MPLTPKALYTKIVLHDYKPTPDELALLNGTVWAHKLNGTTPVAREHPMKAFRAFFEEEVPNIKYMDRAEIAEDILDKVESKFKLHFSDDDADYGSERLPIIKQYITKLLERMDGPVGDLRTIANLTARATDLHELLIKLKLFTH